MNKSILKGFTLLELIVVIVIVGVLTSLAIPHFFKLIERSRAAEALQAISVIRRAIDRCYLMSNTYSECYPYTIGGVFNPNLDIDDPFSSPNSHFVFGGTSIGGTGGAQFAFTICRNSNENPAPQSLPYILACEGGGGGWALGDLGVFLVCVNGDTGSFKIIGGGVYEGMKFGSQ